MGRAALRPLPRLVALLAVLLALGFLLAGTSLADDAACPLPLTDQQRFGFVATSGNWPARFDYAALGGGWVVDFTYPWHDVPTGVDRALALRVYEGYTLDPAQLGPHVDQYPGATWLIGNEPDCIWQDNVWPEEYARVYHDLYTFIKARDPLSRVSPGGIVQPSPLRLEWLDRVLAEYQARYYQAMPVDVWNIHNAILNEQRGLWGGDIPPGIDAEEGVLRDPQDNDSFVIFANQIWAFRQWMADRGYGGYPLIITEYGVLLPELWYGFDVERVGAFMASTFDFMLNTTDPLLGDPNDGYRLVQRWAWFSLDVPAYEPPPVNSGFNGNLFDPETFEITGHGLNYAGHTTSLPAVDYVDLGPGAWEVLDASDLASPTQTISRTLKIRVVNMGATASGAFSVTLNYTGPVSGMLEDSINDLAPGSAQWLTFTLADLQAGSYDITMLVDAEDQVAESRECNNETTMTLVAPTHRLYLVMLTR